MSSFDFMNFQGELGGLQGGLEGLVQEKNTKLKSASDAYTTLLKTTQLNFDSAAEQGKVLMESGAEAFGGIEGTKAIFKAGKKIYNKLKSKADEFNQDQLDKLDQEMADKTEDSFKVKVEGEDDGDGLENLDEDNVDAEVGEFNPDDMTDFSPYRDAPGGGLEEGAEEVGEFGEEVGENLSSNIGEMGSELFSNAFNSFKQGAQNGIDAMTDLFNGGGGTTQPEIEMTDMGDTGRMPVDSDYQPRTEFSENNFGEKINRTTSDDDGIELTEFNKNEGSLESQQNSLEQTEGDAEQQVRTDTDAENDLNDGDVDAAEDVDPELEDIVEDTGEELAGEGVEEAVAGALDWSPIGWIMTAIGAAAAVTTTAVGIADEVKAKNKEEDSLSKANALYQQTKAKVANFNPSGEYAIPSMNSLSTIGE